MKLTGLHINNFMAIGSTRLQLDDMGLVLLQGENQDDTSAASNGSGKSSVLDALCWGLYGETARGEAGDSIVNSVAGKNTGVAVHIEEGEYAYVVQRFRKHKTHKNRLMLGRMRSPFMEGGVLEDLTLGTDKLTQVSVDRLIGCSKQVFSAAIYAGQEQMPDLPGMTDKALKELVEEAAGITTLQAAHEVARERWRYAEQDLAGQALAVKANAAALIDADKALASASSRWTDWNSNQGERIALAAQRVMDSAARIKELEPEVAAAKATALELKGERAAIDAQIAGLRSESVVQMGLSAELTTAAKVTAKAMGKRGALADQVRAAKSAYEHPHTATVGSSCRECGKRITEEDVAPARTAAVETARVELKRLVELYRAAQNDEKAALESEQNARTALVEHESSMTDTSVLSARKRDIDAGVKAAEAVIAQEEPAARALKEAEQAYFNAQEEVNPHAPYVNACKESCVELEQRRVAQTEFLEMAQARVDLAKEVVRVYGPKGVRATILDTVTPFLNDRTAGYLGALSDGNLQASWSTLSLSAAGELMEKFSIAVTGKSGADRFGLLSGGEKRKVRLACAMALQDLVASRASKPINLFMADEIDDALDAAGLERLMGILETKARERGTVIVVSHNELSDWIREQTHVVKKGGVATLSGAMVLA